MPDAPDIVMLLAHGALFYLYFYGNDIGSIPKYHSELTIHGNQTE